MESSKKFTHVIAWQKAHQFVLATYKLTSQFPKEKIYGLTSEFGRAAVSIAANIAEGFGKTGKKDKVRYFNTSQGSIEEEVSKLTNNYSRAISKSI